jgi:cytochrome c oxidase subunit 2
LPRTALGDRAGRLAKLALVPVIGLILLACGEQANNNATGDSAAPGLIGADGFPHEVVTTQGAESASLYLPIFLVAVVIFVLVEGLLLLVILRGRRKGRDGELPSQTHGNNRLEIIWTVIPLIVVMVLFAASTMVLARVEEKSEKPAVVLDVLAFRFGWTFTYKDPASFDPQTATYQDVGVTISSTPSAPSSDQPRDPAQDVVLPVGEPVLFRLNAADVIHSFYVPAFFFKRDAIPGRTNEFEVTIEKAGRYGGQCAEFCGLNHGQMFFNIRAVEPDEYDAWLAEQGGGTAAASAVPSEGTLLEIATTAEKSIAFTTTSLEAQAGDTITVAYTNDSKVPHNIAFYDGPDATAQQIALSETITGPGATTQVTFEAPEVPGAYLFRCELHPMQMIGTLTVVP